MCLLGASLWGKIIKGDDVRCRNEEIEKGYAFVAHDMLNFNNLVVIHTLCIFVLVLTTFFTFGIPD